MITLSAGNLYTFFPHFMQLCRLLQEMWEAVNRSQTKSCNLMVSVVKDLKINDFTLGFHQKRYVWNICATLVNKVSTSEKNINESLLEFSFCRSLVQEDQEVRQFILLLLYLLFDQALLILHKGAFVWDFDITLGIESTTSTSLKLQVLMNRESLQDLHFIHKYWLQIFYTNYCIF